MLSEEDDFFIADGGVNVRAGVTKLCRCEGRTTVVADRFRWLDVIDTEEGEEENEENGDNVEDNKG